MPEEPLVTRYSQADFLSGGGEMGALMRSFDWASTPLGHLDGWPQSLKTSVSTCLNSRFAILVWWGPELVMLYNDAYRFILGNKHPGALGAVGKQVWPEIWHIIGPMLTGVLERAEATWSDDLLLELERNGYPEECYFTFSYSPIHGESGGVGGVFTPVQETTDRVIGSRRLRTLRDLAAIQASNSESAEEVCRLAADVLSQNSHDIPFAALYLLSPDRKQAHLAGVAGIEPETPLTPGEVSPDDPAELWPFARAAFGARAEPVQVPPGLADVPCGAWPVPCDEVLVYPVSIAGQPAGILLSAVSPRKRLDGAYQDFFNLVAGHIATAIAEARAFEEQRKRAKALEEIDRAKTAFFSNVSHEFRTPLTLLLGTLEESLSIESDLTGQVRAQLEVAHRNGLRLLKLVNSLLDFSRIEAGRMEAVYSPVDLAALTAELASLFRSATERTGLQLIVDCAPLPEPVYVDRDMFETIVLNLLSNAFKFTLEGKILVSVKCEAQMAVLSINDTGTGIAEDELPHLFERFHRVEGSRGRTHEGTGIGLALVQELAKLHGGTVAVKSTYGEGSTFKVTIPFGTKHLSADRVAAEPAPQRHSRRGEAFIEEAKRWVPEHPAREGERRLDRPRLAEMSSARKVRGRILLADDNADMRDYMRRLLADRYEVVTVEDGEKALAIAREQLPDLILTDVMMPRLDGFALLRRLRADPQTQAIPVILLSTRAGEDSKVQGLDAGADDYLIKPFSARELLARVGTHLNLALARKRAEQSLIKSEQRFRNTFAAAATGLALTDLQGNFVEVNSAFSEITGYSESELLGLNLYDITHRDDLPRNSEATSKMMSGACESFVIEKRYLRKNGSAVWVRNSVSLLPGTDGKPANIIAITEDITQGKVAEEERVRAQASLEKANQDLRRANQDLEQFAYSASHDLQEPIRTVAVYTELLKKRYAGSLDARADEFIQQIIESAHQMEMLVHDLLAYTRAANSDKSQIDYTDADEVLRATLATLDASIHANDATVTHDALPTLYMGRAHLQQLFQNLISNALKYRNEVSPRIHISAARQNGAWRVSVADNGIGIEPRYQKQIFGIFKRLHGGAKYAGTGIGLAICQKIVERYGGRIWVNSEPGRGSEFQFTVPFKKEDAND